MTKVEGIILNIIPTNGPMAVHETQSQQPLEVYPNPVSDVLYLENLPSETVEYSVFNILGQKVASGSSFGTVPVAALGEGLHVLHVKVDKCLETVKFIVTGPTR